jgi:hypothetical protein
MAEGADTPVPFSGEIREGGRGRRGCSSKVKSKLFRVLSIIFTGEARREKLWGFSVKKRLSGIPLRTKPDVAPV